MKLNIGAAAAASALMWSGCVLIVGVANMVQPQYGKEFLHLVSSIYPGYKVRPRLRNVAVGTAYAVVDGAIGGALTALVYNCFAAKCKADADEQVSPMKAVG